MSFEEVQITMFNLGMMLALDWFSTLTSTKSIHQFKDLEAVTSSRCEVVSKIITLPKYLEETE